MDELSFYDGRIRFGKSSGLLRHTSGAGRYSKATLGHYQAHCTHAVSGLTRWALRLRLHGSPNSGSDLDGARHRERSDAIPSAFSGTMADGDRFASLAMTCVRGRLVPEADRRIIAGRDDVCAGTVG
jgi:hypothetical protein